MQLSVEASVRLAWWLRVWLWCLATASLLSGREPNPDRVAAMAKRGMTTKAIIKRD